MDKHEMYKTVMQQLAVDYNCSPEDFLKSDVVFTEARKLEGRREMPFFEPRLEVITMGRSTIVNASRSILPQVQERFTGKTGYEILTSQLVYGVNPYYLPDIESLPIVENDAYEFKLVDTDIRSYYRYEGCSNALQYNENSKRPEVLCAVAFDNEELAGIACASADSAVMWQIGVDVYPQYRGKGIATKLVNMLTIEALNRGAIPYYTTDCANINSQRVAVKCGYIPAWAHCFKARLSNL